LSKTEIFPEPTGPPSRTTRILRRTVILAAIALIFSLGAAPAGARIAYVGNFGGGVSAIDTATNRAIEVPDGERLIQTGLATRGIAFTPDGRFAYVANLGGVSVIDTATNRAVEVPDGNREIKIGPAPSAIAITPDGRFAYVTHEFGGVSVIDTATNRAIEVPDGNRLIKVGNAVGIAITPDGRFAYVANISGGVSVIDTATNRAVEVPEGNKLIQAPSIAEGVAITPDGRFAYVTSAGAAGVFVIDTATNRPIEVPEGGTLIHVGPEPRAIAMSPDGRLVFVGHQKGGVSAIETATNEAIEVPDGNRQIKAGTGSFGLAVTPDGRFVYVANAAGGVSVIDTATDRTNEVPDGNGLIAAGVNPFTVAIAPDQPPAASFTASRARPGMPVTLDASASRDPDSPIASYAWSFGDGQGQTLGSPMVSHVFASPGTYEVSVRESDAEDCSTSETFFYVSSSAVCDGNPSAQTTRTVTVAYPGVGVRCRKSAGHAGCRFRIQAVMVPPRACGGNCGGPKPRPESAVAKARLRAGRSAIVSLRPKPAFAADLASAKRILVKLTATIRGAVRTRLVKLRVVQ
jgi:YVTN family beta-propeller protein